MILISLITWFAMSIITAILFIAGLILVPIAAICKAYKMTDLNLSKPNDGPIYHFTWPIMFLWDNWEDGIANQNYKKFKSQFMRIFYWSCIRNPVNNLRIVLYLSCKIKPAKVKFVGSLKTITLYDSPIKQWFYAWCGIYSTFYWQFNLLNKRYRFWVGWKIYPTDRYGVTPYRQPGAGFTLQLKRV